MLRLADDIILFQLTLRKNKKKSACKNSLLETKFILKINKNKTKMMDIKNECNTAKIIELQLSNTMYQMLMNVDSRLKQARKDLMEKNRFISNLNRSRNQKVIQMSLWNQAPLWMLSIGQQESKKCKE